MQYSQQFAFTIRKLAAISSVLMFASAIRVGAEPAKEVRFTGRVDVIRAGTPIGRCNGLGIKLLKHIDLKGPPEHNDEIVQVWDDCDWDSKARLLAIEERKARFTTPDDSKWRILVGACDALEYIIEVANPKNLVIRVTNPEWSKVRCLNRGRDEIKVGRKAGAGKFFEHALDIKSEWATYNEFLIFLRSENKFQDCAVTARKAVTSLSKLKDTDPEKIYLGQAYEHLTFCIFWTVRQWSAQGQKPARVDWIVIMSVSDTALEKLSQVGQTQLRTDLVNIFHTALLHAAGTQEIRIAARTIAADAGLVGHWKRWCGYFLGSQSSSCADDTEKSIIFTLVKFEKTARPKK